MALRQIPGPGMIAFLRGVRREGFLEYVEQLWRTYGDLFQVRLGPRRLIFALHPEAVGHVNVGNRQNYDKLGSYALVRARLLGNGLLASTGDLWRRQRKLMAPFYTPKGVQAYATIMLQDSERLVARWHELSGRAAHVEISEEMTMVTASIILKSMFSTETMESIVEMKDAVETMIAFVSAQQSGLRAPLWVPTAGNRKYLAARDLVLRIPTIVISSSDHREQSKAQGAGSGRFLLSS